MSQDEPARLYTAADFARRKDARRMTRQERVSEMKRLGGTHVHVAFSDWLRRVDELVGRPVDTHEIGLAWDELVEEARTQQHPDAAQIIARAQRSGKPVIVGHVGEDGQGG